MARTREHLLTEDNCMEGEKIQGKGRKRKRRGGKFRLTKRPLARGEVYRTSNPGEPFVMFSPVEKESIEKEEEFLKKKRKKRRETLRGRNRKKATERNPVQENFISKKRKEGFCQKGGGTCTKKDSQMGGRRKRE